MKALLSGLKSKNTTVVAFLVAAQMAITAVIATIDGNESTTADWNVVINSVLIAIGLLLARDSDKSSKKVGAQ